VYIQTGIQDTFQTVTTLEYDRDYFWRVRSVNHMGAGSFSEVWAFATALTPPVTPVLVGPPSASADQPPFVRLSWRNTPHTEKYHLQVSLNPSFAVTTRDDSTLTDTVSVVGPLEYTKTYFWRVRAINADWTTAFSPVYSLTVMGVPTAFALFQNYPNPANPSTVIRYDLPRESNIRLFVYNVLGQEVKRLVDTRQSPGRYEVSFDAKELPSGMYIYRLDAVYPEDLLPAGTPPPPGWTEVRKMLIVR
jgi:hypothetical protein